ncbi:hypothetical protein GCM10020331_102720 [Ectobacillus funiculus]
MKIKHSRVDRMILGVNNIFLCLAVLIVLVPLVYIVIASFMNPTVLLNKGISFNVSDWSLKGYKTIFIK